MQQVIALRFHSSWCKNVMLHEVSCPKPPLLKLDQLIAFVFERTFLVDLIAVVRELSVMILSGNMNPITTPGSSFLNYHNA